MSSEYTQISSHRYCFFENANNGFGYGVKKFENDENYRMEIRFFKGGVTRDQFIRFLNDNLMVPSTYRSAMLVAQMAGDDAKIVLMEAITPKDDIEHSDVKLQIA